jgi:LPS sulfotransferase NodH
VLQTLTEDINRMSSPSQIKLCFTVGKAHQDLGEYEAAFEAFNVGNDLHYRRYPYDYKSNFKMLDDIRNSIDAQYLNTQQALDTKDNSPIFILGMPRSGSTLLEQILASHSAVSAAGELKHLQNCIQTYLIRDKGTFGNAISSWTERALEDTSTAYLKQLHRHGFGAQRIVDKMPGNFAFVGLIHRLFPNAKIVHTTRHPMATIWSNFSTHFGDAMHYTYKLDVLCRYYKQVDAMMAHWNTVLPQGTVHELAYERLVQDPEASIRALLDYLQLPWEAGCLNFHKTRRTVKTASIAQVTRPLYTSALNLWKNYRKQLQSCEREL